MLASVKSELFPNWAIEPQIAPVSRSGGETHTPDLSYKPHFFAGWNRHLHWRHCYWFQGGTRWYKESLFLSFMGLKSWSEAKEKGAVSFLGASLTRGLKRGQLPPVHSANNFWKSLNLRFVPSFSLFSPSSKLTSSCLSGLELLASSILHGWVVIMEQGRGRGKVLLFSHVLCYWLADAKLN